MPHTAGTIPARARNAEAYRKFWNAGSRAAPSGKNISFSMGGKLAGTGVHSYSAGDTLKKSSLEIDFRIGSCVTSIAGPHGGA